MTKSKGTGRRWSSSKWVKGGAGTLGVWSGWRDADKINEDPDVNRPHCEGGRGKTSLHKGTRSIRAHCTVCGTLYMEYLADKGEYRVRLRGGQDVSGR